MIKLTPIPKALRPFDMDVFLPLQGGFGGGFEEEPKHIRSVRYDKACTTRNGGYVFQEGSSGLIYVDATSEGAFDIPAGARIEINGEQLTCVKCTPFEGFNAEVHHWEIEVK